MQPTSSRKKSTVRRLTPSQRTLRVLVCLVVVITSLPLSVQPAGADYTTEDWRVDLDNIATGIADVEYVDGKVIVHTQSGPLVPEESRLIALDAGTGAEIWNVSSWRAPFDRQSLAVIPSEDAVYTVGNNSHGALKYDLDTGAFINNGTAQSTRYEAIDATRNRSRLYAVRGDDVVELDTTRPREVAEITPGNSPVRLAVSEQTGRVFVEGTGIEAYNAELSTIEWSTGVGGPLDTANGFVFTDSHKIDEDDGSNITGGAGNTISVTAPENATTLYTGQDTANGNISEWRQGDYTRIDTVDITPNDEAGINNIATDDTKNEVVVFASTRNSVIVRHSTDTITTEGEENLELDVPGYLEHGEVENYEVTATVYNETREEFVTRDVTDSANVTSLNTTLLTIDTNRTRVVATTDESVNGEVTVRAEAENLTTQEEIAVAAKTVPNLDLLPPWVRVEASLEDKTLQVIIVATMLGVAVSSLAGVFAGISTMTIVMIGGWIIEYVGDGMIIVTVLAGMMIGMNVAGNVDYSIRR